MCALLCLGLKGMGTGELHMRLFNFKSLDDGHSAQEFSRRVPGEQHGRVMHFYKQKLLLLFRHLFK